MLQSVILVLHIYTYRRAKHFIFHTHPTNVIFALLQFLLWFYRHLSAEDMTDSRGTRGFVQTDNNISFNGIYYMTLM